MRRKIIIYLFTLFIFFASGTLLTAIYIKITTTDFSRLIALHEIEDLRQNLVKNIQTSQTDLYTVRTPLGQSLDSIIKNVSQLKQSAQKCISCHHGPALFKQLKEVQTLIYDYEKALSYYITGSANTERMDNLKSEAAAIGNKLLIESEEMSLRASKSLKLMTNDAIRKIEKAKSILYVTTILTFILGIIIAAKLTVSITKPARELLTATRMIASGKLGYKVLFKDKTEFGEIASNFNEMSIALKEGYEGMQREITDRKRTEEALRESEQRYQKASNIANFGYWELDIANKTFFLSEEARRIFDINRNISIVKYDNFIELVCHADQEMLSVSIDKAISNGKQLDLECRINRPGGTDRIVHLIAEAQTDMTGKVKSQMGIIHDITEYTHAYEARERLILELQNALAKIKTLSGMLPICSSCKKIRDDKGYWNQIENYISAHSRAEFTHGICPDCMERYSKYDDEEA
jgi:PAS domain-containing protein